MNLDRTNINLSQLRTNRQFTLLMEQLQLELMQAREAYEMQEASEFLRGRVSALKELIEAIEGNAKPRRE